MQRKNGMVPHAHSPDTSPWKISGQLSPIIAVALHDGNVIRESLIPSIALTVHERLREEDPYTSEWLAVAPSQVLVERSRFEVDLNRPRERAVYQTPDDAWGLRVWKQELLPDQLSESLTLYDRFYADLRERLDLTARTFGKFVVYDLHAYNHRRKGPEQPAAPTTENPEINVGTATMDRQYWAPVVDAFLENLREFRYQGRYLQVEENVRFQGGYLSEWIHENYPNTGCSLSIEIKKFFMDEWTGRPDKEVIRELRRALHTTVIGVREALETYE